MKETNHEIFDVVLRKIKIDEFLEPAKSALFDKHDLIEVEVKTFEVVQPGEFEFFENF